MAAAIARAGHAGRPAAVIPDIESDDDLRTVAEGVALAEKAGSGCVIRSGPAFVAILTGREAHGRVPAPVPAAPLLLICGSYVAGTTAQLERLAVQRPGIITSVDVARITASDGAELERVVSAASASLTTHGVAVVATQRGYVSGLGSAASLEVAERLAEVVRRVEPAPAVVASKGGVTSAVVARSAFRAAHARVVGPILSGVSLWTVASDSGPARLIVVPGNVGGPDLLADLLELLDGKAQ